MENLCIRVRFTPLMKKVSKKSSKFCLEIVPLISGVENFDNINWKRKNDKIEYIIPMNYKIIIKKLKPNDEAVKMFYSCVDLLPSSLSNIDVTAGEVYKVISDNFTSICNRTKNNLVRSTSISQFDLKMHQTPCLKKKISLSALNNNENSVLIPDISRKMETTSLAEKIEEAVNKPSPEKIKITNVDRSTSNHNYWQEYPICTRSISRHQKRLSVTPIYTNTHQIYTEDYSPPKNLRTSTGSSLFASLFRELDILKHNNINMRKNRLPTLSPNHNQDSPNDMLISHMRIQPEERVAKFVAKMEEEILPLKIILNNIIGKCSTLGFNSKLNNALLDHVISGSYKIKRRNFQKEINYNRVVYSVAFDE